MEQLASHLHGMVVHFPIALLLTALVLEAAALYKPWREKLHSVNLVLLLLGTLGAAAAVITGPDENFRGISQVGRVHENLAQLTLAFFAVVTALRLFVVWKKQAISPRLQAAFLAMLVIGAGLISYTGYLGGEMVYAQGIGVQVNGKLVNPPVTRSRGQ
jgi:uncharacterized membrane protein